MAADPLSIAGSVVGIVSLGLQTTQYLVNYYRAVRDQEADATTTTKKLESLLDVLETLCDETKTRKFHSDERKLLAYIESSVGECRGSISELQNEVNRFKKEPTNPIPDTNLSKPKRIAHHFRRSVRSSIHIKDRITYPFRQSTLERLDKNIDEILDRLSMSQQLLLQKDLRRIRDDNENVKAVLALIRTTQVSSEIRDWLKAPDATVNFNEASAKRHPKTGLWFVEGLAFSSWLKKPNSFLWLNGFAGSGKSVLCSTAIQYAFRHRQSNRRVGIAFFFFTFNDDSKQDTSAMLRALVLQLSSQLNDHTILEELRDSYRNASPPAQALKDCLRRLVHAFQDVYVILDALDESPRNKHRDDVLQSLVDMHAWSERGLHILATSRDLVDIRDEIDVLADEIVPMKNDAIKEDIASFVSQHLRESSRLRKWAKHHERIESVLTERAKGGFRWVICQFQALASCPRSEELLDRLLNSLPETLDETYKRMLEKLIDGMALDFVDDTPTFNPKRRLEDLKSIQDVCPGFLEVSTDVDTKLVDTPFINTKFINTRFIDTKELTIHPIVDFIRRYFGLETFELVALSYASALGLVSTVRKLWDDMNLSSGNVALITEACPPETVFLEKLEKANAQSEEWAAILVLASYYGHEGLVRLALNKNTDVNQETGYYWKTALNAAAAGGHETVFRLLLDQNAHLERRDEEGNTPLISASWHGNEKIVQLLLDRNAVINLQHASMTPLGAASAKGDERLVRLLLDKNADVDLPDKNGNTALCLGEGYDKIVQLLLDRNANANTRNNYGGTALFEAVEYGHEKVVRLLPDHDVDVNHVVNQIAHMLLDTKADIPKKLTTHPYIKSWAGLQIAG
ncbi:hypothetical protein DL769_001102 [Monosporascus sp. CRB-8-3]|nr:hypothetical protein DL769_001102 [Monosporascus sp. CRB-8-3]